MSNNIQRLGNMLTERMLKTANAAVGVYTEMGIINENMTLTPDSLQADIPQEDYLIQAGQKVQSGDRVLIAWAGSNPIVIGPAAETEQPLPITVTSDGEGNVTITF